MSNILRTRKYDLAMELTVVKHAVVRDIEATDLDAAIKAARARIKAGQVEWGNAQVGDELVEIIKVIG